MKCSVFIGTKGINDLKVATNNTKVSHAIQEWYKTSCGNSVKSPKGTKFIKHILILNNARKDSALGANRLWVPVMTDKLLELGYEPGLAYSYEQGTYDLVFIPE